MTCSASFQLLEMALSTEEWSDSHVSVPGAAFSGAAAGDALGLAESEELVRRLSPKEAPEPADWESIWD